VATQPNERKELLNVCDIGIAPHKSTHTAVAVDGDEQPIARFTFPARVRGRPISRPLSGATPAET
jgi:hypothetical protein